jgi:hypothetical protein
MSEHVIQNPVPTPEQMATLLGVSQARVVTLRNIMHSEAKPVPSICVAKTSAPLRQFKMRKKSSSGVKAAAR